MKPDLSFLDAFEDKYLKTKQGKGVFLAGVVLGVMAGQQVSNIDDIQNSPLFKQLNFGRITIRDLKKHLARMPELIKAYNMKYSFLLQQLGNSAGTLLLEGGGQELGVEGNFAFTVAFANAREFFWNNIFPREDKDQLPPIEEESEE